MTACNASHILAIWPRRLSVHSSVCISSDGHCCQRSVVAINRLSRKCCSHV